MPPWQFVTAGRLSDHVPTKTDDRRRWAYSAAAPCSLGKGWRMVRDPAGLKYAEMVRKCRSPRLGGSKTRSVAFSPPCSFF
jgi:hypothetical protein